MMSVKIADEDDPNLATPTGEALCRAVARLGLLLIPAFLVTACGTREAAEPGKNEAQRVAEQIRKQGEQIGQQAENGAAAIEQALENEGAVIFENRGNLLNQAAPDAAGNSSRNAPVPR